MIRGIGLLDALSKGMPKPEGECGYPVFPFSFFSQMSRLLLENALK